MASILSPKALSGPRVTYKTFDGGVRVPMRAYLQCLAYGGDLQDLLMDSGEALYGGEWIAYSEREMLDAEIQEAC